MLYRISQVAEKLNMDKQTIRSYIRRGIIKAIRPGGKMYLVSEDEINRLLRRK